MAWLFGIGRFCWQWIAFAVACGSIVGNIAKAGTFVLLLVYAVKDDNRLNVFVASDAASVVEKPMEVPLALHPTIGAVDFTLVLFVWVAIAFGVTLSRHRFLEIGDAMDRDITDRVWRLQIRNHGTSAEVPVYGVAVADERHIASTYDPAAGRTVLDATRR